MITLDLAAKTTRLFRYPICKIITIDLVTVSGDEVKGAWRQGSHTVNESDSKVIIVKAV